MLRFPSPQLGVAGWAGLAALWTVVLYVLVAVAARIRRSVVRRRRVEWVRIVDVNGARGRKSLTSPRPLP